MMKCATELSLGETDVLARVREGGDGGTEYCVGPCPRSGRRCGGARSRTLIAVDRAQTAEQTEGEPRDEQ